MATIYKRKIKDGARVRGWKAAVHIKGCLTVCEIFDRKQEADDWVQQIEHKIKMGQFKFERLKTLHTFDDLIVQLHHELRLGTL